MKINKISWYNNSGFPFLYRTGIIGYFQRASDTLLEKDRTKNFARVLELAATDLNHLQFIKHSFEWYIVSDLFTYDNLEKSIQTNKLTNVRALQLNVVEISSLGANEFDRIISTCLLPHLNKEEILISIKGVKKVLQYGGIADFLVPCQYRILWNLGRLLFVTPKLLLRKINPISYFRFAASDHKTRHPQVLEICKKVAELEALEIEITKWPNTIFPPLYLRITLRKQEK